MNSCVTHLQRGSPGYAKVQSNDPVPGTRNPNEDGNVFMETEEGFCVNPKRDIRIVSSIRVVI